MKRALLIAGGTLGGLGAVLSITPPQLGGTATAPGTNLGGGSTNAGAGLGSGTQTSAAGPQTATPVATPVSTKPAAKPSATPTKKKTTKPTATKKATPAATKSSNNSQGGTQTSSTPTPAATPTPTPTPTPTQTKTQTPTPTPTPTKAAAKGVSGTFTGNTYQANQGGRVWGNVTVQVTLVDGAVSSIQASQNPQSRGQYAFNWLTPAIKTQKLTVADIMAIKPSSLLGSNSGASYSAMAYWQSLQSALTKSGA